LKKIFLILFLSISSFCIAQNKEAEKLIEEGNAFYKQQQYDQAAAKYSEALQLDAENTTAKFNLANTTYRLNKQDEASKSFQDLAEQSKEKALSSKSHYNKGVILSKQKKLEESIDAYKNALRKDPNDKEARENLQKALLELKKKNPPKKQDQDKKKDQQQQKQPQSKMNQKEAEQRLKLLEQKEKEVQQRLQNEKSKSGGGQGKDW
jgi:Ca-activated chloride channel family protein